ncbi:hypothetical protein sync_0780 [Synechococcus sp. CC9311]|nr:hypothetical protein sync_0780 [Synechococcus sp. CC9311]
MKWVAIVLLLRSVGSCVLSGARQEHVIASGVAVALKITSR